MTGVRQQGQRHTRFEDACKWCAWTVVCLFGQRKMWRLMSRDIHAWKGLSEHHTCKVRILDFERQKVRTREGSQTLVLPEFEGINHHLNNTAHEGHCIGRPWQHLTGLLPPAWQPCCIFVWHASRRFYGQCAAPSGACVTFSLCNFVSLSPNNGRKGDTLACWQESMPAPT